jgi:hypothetical protein
MVNASKLPRCGCGEGGDNSEVRRTIVYFVAGLASGVATKAVDDVAGRTESVAGAVLSALGSAPALWMLIVVGIAMLERRSMRLAVVRGVAFFLGLSAGYYAYSEVLLGFSGAGLVIFWTVAALTAVPVAIGLVLWAHAAANDAAVSSRRRLLGWVVIGAILSLPMIQLAAYGVASTDGTSERSVSLLNAATQLPIITAIWLLLARTSAARLGSLAAGLLLAWPAWLGLELLFRLLTSLAGLTRE